MELSKEQKAIVEATESKIVVVASAASGKTAVLVERVRYLLNKGVEPTKIVLITFTNAAAEELAERLDHPKGLFIGTIHSYANYLLLAHGKETSDLLENEQFDRLFERIKKHPNCIKEVEHLLLDESQDSTPQQFEFLLDMVQPKNYMLVGDHKQSIYRWNGAYPDYLLDLANNRDVTTYDLLENYRNGYKILDFAKNIIRSAGYEYSDTSRPMRGVSGKVVDVEYSSHAIAETIKSYGNYGEWFILTRTNDQIDEMTRVLAALGVPYDTFKRSALDNKELGKKMKENTVKVLTIHTAKGLEANNVVVIGAKFFNTEERCVSYVAATRARNMLVWTRMPSRRKSNYGMSSWER
jgi:DNA helicase-2/ATP-dependent DNA helicase PcrA